MASMRNIVTFVLGGGRGTRLYPLTKFRSKPAVPLAAKYRLIDIPISNCINSGLRRIYVLTQFMSVSLHRHIRKTYSFDSFSGGFVEILAAQQTMDAGTDWYQGTADAVRKNVRYLDQQDVDNVLILSGDQLYRMDFRDMLKTHEETNADVTIAGIPVTRDVASSLGIMRLNDSGRVTGFVEKPKTDEELSSVQMEPSWIDSHGVQSNGRDCVASMGIYLFRRELLVDVLRSTEHEDFGREVFPSLIEPRHVQLHLFDGYWEDIGTIKAFYEANLQLAQQGAPFDLAKPEATIYSRARFLPPSRVDGANISRSVVADGCTIGKGTVIENSVIGLRCKIGENVTIKDSVVMGSDFYETGHDIQTDAAEHRPPVGVGSGSTIISSIIDKNCRIGQNVVIDPTTASATEGEDFVISDGVAVLVKNATVNDNRKL